MKNSFLLGLCLVCSSVLAHPYFDGNVIEAGVTSRAILMITHGCGDSHTIRIVVDVPKEVRAITPGVKPGWTIELVESKLSEPRVVFGMETTKYTSQIIWSGGNLSTDYMDVFHFVVIPPGSAQTLYFPTTQICIDGVEAYTEIPDPAKPDEELVNRAPYLKVVDNLEAIGN